MPMLASRLQLHNVTDAKTCNACGEHKPLANYYRGNNCPDGHRGTCITCCAKNSARYYQERGKELQKVYQQHKTATDPDYRAARRDRQLRGKFGITLADFREMLALQDDTCAICCQLPERSDLLHVDHDHSTGAIRGILCSNCNRGLGYFKDNTNRMRAAIAYLEGK